MPPTPSAFGIVMVPTVPAQNVGPFYVAANEAAMRLLVRNLGGATIFLAFSSSDLNGLTVTSQRFELPNGTSEVFVLQPRQQIFAVATGANTRLSYASSVALPVQGV